MENIFAGGNCNPNGLQSNAANPMKNLLNNMVMSKGVAAMHNPNARIIDPGMQTVGGMMNQMNQVWADSKTHSTHIDAQSKMMMQQAWQQSKMKEAQMMHAQQTMGRVYQAEMERAQAEHWKNDFIQNEVLNAKEKELNDAFSDAKIQEEITNMENKQATGSLIDMMSKDPDPRFQNSKFLGFLKQVQTGELELTDNNQLLHHPEKAVAQLDNLMGTMNTAFADAGKQEQQKEKKFEMMEGAFVQAHNQVIVEDAKLNSMEKDFGNATEKVENDIANRAQRKAQELQKMWEDMARNYDPQNPELMNELQAKWEEGFKEWDEEGLADHWNVAQDIEEATNIVPNQYQHDKNNPYLNSENPHRIFFKLIEEGNTTNAITALEAHLQKQPQDHTGWRMLGVLLQENDQDNHSIVALCKALEINQKCPETLYQLGISCTNVFDELTSMMYLHEWLAVSDFGDVAGNKLIDKERLAIDNYTQEECMAINQILLERFEAARARGPITLQLLSCLGVLYYVGRKYQKAVESFQAALHIDPHSYSTWNKFGASLAHLGQNKLAKDAYHKALDLKPNFMRTWVNLAFNYGNAKDYQTALHFYLNGVSLNPKAVQLWTHIESNLVTQDKYEMIKMLKAKNPQLLGQANNFEVINYKNLPAPESVSYLKMAEKYLLGKTVEEWATQFDKNTLAAGN